MEVRRAVGPTAFIVCLGIAAALLWARIHGGVTGYIAQVWMGHGVSLGLESRPYGVVFTLLTHQLPPDRYWFSGRCPVGSRWEISDGVERVMTYDPEPFPDRRLGFGVARRTWDQFAPLQTGAGLFATSTLPKLVQRQVVAPYWFLMALVLAWPAWRWTKRLRRLRRIEQGRCAACSYDLRESAERCPECGLATTRRGLRTPQRFVSDALLGAAGAVSALLVIHLWALPATMPTGQAPQESSRLPFLPLWAAPIGADRDRMVSAAQPGQMGQAVWKSPDGDRLIVINLFGTIMFSEFLRVWEFDHTPRLVRTGTVGVVPDSTPYTLVEIRSDDPAEPQRFRSKWLLAVVTWRAGQKYDPGKPVVLFNPDDRRANEVSIALVKWDAEPSDPDNDTQKFLFAPDLKMRSAENPPFAVPNK